jgi:hypothetical protein
VRGTSRAILSADHCNVRHYMATKLPLSVLIAAASAIAVPILMCIVMIGSAQNPLHHWITLIVVCAIYGGCSAGILYGLNWVRKLYTSVFGLMLGMCVVSWLVPFRAHIRGVGRPVYAWYATAASECVLVAHFLILVCCFLPRSNSYFVPLRSVASQKNA